MKRKTKSLNASTASENTSRNLTTLLMELTASREETEKLKRAMWTATLSVMGEPSRYEELYGKRLLHPLSEEIKQARAHLTHATQLGQITPRTVFLSDAAWYALNRLATLSKSQTVEETLVALISRAQTHNGLINLTSLTTLFRTAYERMVSNRNLPRWLLPNAVRLIQETLLTLSSSTRYRVKNGLTYLKKIALAIMPEFYYFCKKYVKNKNYDEIYIKAMESDDPRVRARALETMEREGDYEVYIRQLRELYDDAETLQFRMRHSKDSWDNKTIIYQEQHDNDDDE